MLSKRLQVHYTPHRLVELWMTHPVVPTSFNTTTEESVKLYLEKFSISFPEILMSISFLWQKMKLPDIQHYLVPLNFVDFTHIKFVKIFTLQEVDLTLSVYTICFIASNSGWRNVSARISKCSYPGIFKPTGRRNLWYMYLSYQLQKILRSENFMVL
jgi:hypothetical protein